MAVNIYPKLKFQLNSSLDSEVGIQSLDVKAGGVDFGRRIIELHPELESSEKVTFDTRRKIISGYTKKYYLANKIIIVDSLRQMESNWKSVEKHFFEGVSTVFGNITWPKGDYTCYLSVFDCNPRFLENKSFQVYFQHQFGSNHVIAHEILHFAFFDYLENQESELSHSVGEHTKWLVSEWFNDLVLDLPRFKNFSLKLDSGYPEVIEFAKKFNKIGKNKFSIQNFFQTIKTNL